jgi:hypothetical protein
MIARNVLIAFALIATTAPATAATITRTFAFTGTNIQNISGTTPSPLSSVSLNFTVTFDPLVGVPFPGQSSGLTLNSTNLTLGSPFAFVFAPGSNQRMTLGGTANGVFGISANNDDFTLDFTGAGGATPQVSIFQFATSGTPGNAYRAFTTALTFTDLVAPVPEPATWALLILGFGAMGVLMRRRRRIIAIA